MQDFSISDNGVYTFSQLRKNALFPKDAYDNSNLFLAVLLVLARPITVTFIFCMYLDKQFFFNYCKLWRKSVNIEIWKTLNQPDIVNYSDGQGFYNPHM